MSGKYRERFTRNKLTDERQQILSQEKKRKQFLLRQKSLRQDRLNKARELITLERNLPQEEDQCDVEDIEEVIPFHEQQEDEVYGREQQSELRSKKGKHKRSQRKKDKTVRGNLYREYIQEPEWMVEIPNDLRCSAPTGEDDSKWIVVPRPEGQRCLVIARGGRTVSRVESGHILHTFTSALPGGSAHRRGTASSSAILDCVYCTESDAYYVVDVIFWNEVNCCDCDVSFRFYWLQSQLEELGDALTQRCRWNERVFNLVPRFPCTAVGLECAYLLDTLDQFGYRKNGLLFFHIEGHYELGGLTPLVLLWKDANTCRYVSEADSHHLTRQTVVLKVETEGCGLGNIADTLHYGRQFDINEVEMEDEACDVDLGDESTHQICNRTIRLCTREGICLLEVDPTTFDCGPFCSENGRSELNNGDLVRGTIDGAGFRYSSLSPTTTGDTVVPSVDAFRANKIWSGASAKGARYADSWSKVLFKHMLKSDNCELQPITYYDLMDLTS